MLPTVPYGYLGERLCLYLTAFHNFLYGYGVPTWAKICGLMPVGLIPKSCRKDVDALLTR